MDTCTQYVINGKAKQLLCGQTRPLKKSEAVSAWLLPRTPWQQEFRAGRARLLMWSCDPDLQRTPATRIMYVLNAPGRRQRIAHIQLLIACSGRSVPDGEMRCISRGIFAASRLMPLLFRRRPAGRPFYQRWAALARLPRCRAGPAQS